MSTKKQVLTDPILKKGHVHEEKKGEPVVCQKCDGTGWLRLWNVNCNKCDGEGVIYK